MPVSAVFCTICLFTTLDVHTIPHEFKRDEMRSSLLASAHGLQVHALARLD